MTSTVPCDHRGSSARLVVARPFLKWAGGKTHLISGHAHFFPAVDSIRTYHEPFVGSAAVFFGLRPACAVLSDSNAELIHCYAQIRDNVDAVITALAGHRYDEDHFYVVRKADPRYLSPAERAARTIFLNRVGWNGLYRVNSRGEFNVPFGRHTNPRICDAPNLRAVASALRGVDLRVAPFEAVLDRAKEGDFVYLDPPYVPVSATSNFTAYDREGFGVREQRRLAAVVAELSDAGIRVMVSNSYTPLVVELYQALRGFRMELIDVRRAINSKADARGPVREVVVVNY
ncbi:MAG: DNA adenine methylase [Deltaproteobacteria bacterium]|nr:DNA adenine methylase [Deltaproteobacteria bacterium]